MKRITEITLATLLGTAFLATVPTAGADDESLATKQAISNAAISFNDVVGIALEKVPGIVLEAEFESEDGKSVWEVEVFATDDKVYEVAIDVSSGEAVVVPEDSDD